MQAVGGFIQHRSAAEVRLLRALLTGGLGVGNFVGRQCRPSATLGGLSRKPAMDAYEGAGIRLTERDQGEKLRLAL
jgi:hypothetical protein